MEPPAAPAGPRPLVAYTPTHGLDLTPDGKELWVTSMVGDGVYVYDIATKKLSDKIPTGRAPNWLTFSPDGRYCCVSNADSHDCSTIDAKTRREVTAGPRLTGNTACPTPHFGQLGHFLAPIFGFQLLIFQSTKIFFLTFLNFRNLLILTC